jgi:hypothetical protein
LKSGKKIFITNSGVVDFPAHKDLTQEENEFLKWLVLEKKGSLVSSYKKGAGINYSMQIKKKFGYNSHLPVITKILADADCWLSVEEIMEARKEYRRLV